MSFGASYTGNDYTPSVRMEPMDLKMYPSDKRKVLLMDGKGPLHSAPGHHPDYIHSDGLPVIHAPSHGAQHNDDLALPDDALGSKAAAPPVHNKDKWESYIPVAAVVAVVGLGVYMLMK